MKKIVLILILSILQFMDVNAQLGTIDPNFSLGTGFTGTGITQARVEIINQQTDGKLLVGGWFTSYNENPASRIARLNLDGTIDSGFNTGTGFTGFSPYVKAIALQPDGKIVVGGNFTAFNGTNRHRIARLNSDGSLDTGFNPLTGLNSDVNAIALQPDGKIVIGGIFTFYDWLNSGGISRPRIARLNADGSLDTSFDPQAGFGSAIGSQERVVKIIVQPDGKILTCGQFEQFNGTTRMMVARLNENGTLDNSFDAGANFQLNFGTYGDAKDMKLLPNGKILLIGSFSHTGANNSGVVLLNTDGSIDSSFNLNKKATAVGMQSDGKIYISETGPYNFNRYNSNGTADTSFPETVFNSLVQTIFTQDDGKILIGGWFSYNPTGMMRLLGETLSTDIPHIVHNQVKFKIYPNPATSQVTIDVTNTDFNSSATTLTLIDLQGKILFEKIITENITKLNVEDLSKGIYFVRLNNTEKQETKKIIID